MVVLVATYGTDIWWPGFTLFIAKEALSPQTTRLCDFIDKAVILALRAVILVWRTTLNIVLGREGGITPVIILLEGDRLPSCR